MKKTIILALLCFFGLTQLNAQKSFRPGIKGGLNFSRFSQVDNPNERFTYKTDFYLGLYGALQLSKIYTMQPELVYSRQGSGKDYYDVNKVQRSATLNVSYIGVALANKFTFNKINFQVGPTIDIKINDTKKNIYPTANQNNPYYVYNNNYFTDSNDIDIALFLGAGYDFTKNFGIEARVKKGVIPVNSDYDVFGSSVDFTNLVFQVGATYTFDVK